MITHTHSPGEMKPPCNYNLFAACYKCGSDINGRLSCCAKGATWEGKCGHVGDTKFKYTWGQGLRICLCPKCGSDNTGRLSCCGQGGAWQGDCGFPGNTMFGHTWGEGLRACVCLRCGTDNLGRASCCGQGGSWKGKCGYPGDTGFDHTWGEGLRACKQETKTTKRALQPSARMFACVMNRLPT